MKIQLHELDRSTELCRLMKGDAFEYEGRFYIRGFGNRPNDTIEVTALDNGCQKQWSSYRTVIPHNLYATELPCTLKP